MTTSRALASTAGRRVLALLSLLAILLAGLPVPAGAVEEPDKPSLFGLASADFRTEFPAFAAEAGKYPAFLQMFWALELEWPNAWSGVRLDDLHAMGGTPFIQLTADDIYDFNAGADDAALDGVISNLADWIAKGGGRGAIIAPFPEANLEQHVWGGDPAAYKTAFSRIRAAFLEAGLGPDVIRYAFAMNGPGDHELGYDDYYPGDEIVDIIGFSKLNRNNPWRDYELTFGVHLEEMQELVGTSKPILIIMTGSVESGGERDAWLTEMFERLGAHDQVIGAMYYNKIAYESSGERDFRILVDGVLEPVVVTGYAAWSEPSAASWIFDGRMDSWIESREAEVAATPGAPEFGDVAGSPFIADITWLAEEGITKGCNPPENSEFCPNAPVTRGQMAAFLARALGYTTVGSVEFVDDNGSVFETDIERIANAGVTLGCNPPSNDRYCPDAPVTRAQMAAFLHRALDGLALAASAPNFVDDNGSIFEPDIEWLAAAGITLGCNPPANDRFCPDQAVTRAQMAAFLHRALG